jgi:hypothetical protein
MMAKLALVSTKQMIMERLVGTKLPSFHEVSASSFVFLVQFFDPLLPTALPALICRQVTCLSTRPTQLGELPRISILR